MTFPPLVDLLPHRPPMILLDRVIGEQDQGVTCEVTIAESSLFVRDGVVPAVVFVEYMAQAIAAYAGLKAGRNSETVRVGLLLGAREIRFFAAGARVGDRLEVSADRRFGDELLGNFQCEVRRGGEVLAHGALSVYQGDIKGIEL